MSGIFQWLFHLALQLLQLEIKNKWKTLLVKYNLSIQFIISLNKLESSFQTDHSAFQICSRWFLFFLIFIFTLFYFSILYWFCHRLTWIHHGCTCVPKHEPPSHLPPKKNKKSAWTENKDLGQIRNTLRETQDRLKAYWGDSFNL